MFRFGYSRLSVNFQINGSLQQTHPTYPNQFIRTYNQCLNLSRGIGVIMPLEYGPKWMVEDTLAKSGRPGRDYCDFQLAAPQEVPLEQVDEWIGEVQKLGIKSIICLLGDDQLPFYEKHLPQGLLEYYSDSGFVVVSVPTEDYKEGVLDHSEVKEIYQAYLQLEPPILIHCSAGISRTMKAIKFIRMKEQI